jgi:ribulose bisphosphate carboxylase small subunit
MMKERKHSREYYTCKRLRLLQYLIERGFEPYTEMPDPTNYKMRWWLFKGTVELDEAIDEYFAQFKKEA